MWVSLLLVVATLVLGGLTDYSPKGSPPPEAWDADTDGAFDRIRVFFDEITQENLNSSIAAGAFRATVGGATATVLSATAAANNTYVDFSIEELTGAGTGIQNGVLPTLSYNATLGTVKEVGASDVLLTFSVTAVDRANPVVRFFGFRSDTQVYYLKFSELMNNSVGAPVFVDRTGVIPQTFNTSTSTLETTGAMTLYIDPPTPDNDLPDAEALSTMTLPELILVFDHITVASLVSLASAPQLPVVGTVEYLAVTANNNAGAAATSLVTAQCMTKSLPGSPYISSVDCRLTTDIVDSSLSGVTFTVSQQENTSNTIDVTTSTGNFPDDNAFRFTLNNATRFLSGTRVAFNHTGQITDWMGRLKTGLTVSNANSKDGAAPALLSATSQSGFTNLTVTFSEGVVLTGLLFSDFSLGGTSSPIGFTSGATGATNDTYVLQANRSFAAADIGSSVLSMPTASRFRDSSSNFNAADLQVTTHNTDTTPPSVLVFTTRDMDDDGFVDAIDVSFAPGSTLGAVNGSDGWDVANFTVIGTEAVTPLLLRLLLMQHDDVPGDTDATPEVSYTPPGQPVIDENGNPLGAINATVAVDGAPPILLSASADNRVTTLNLTFSEPPDLLLTTDIDFDPSDREVTDLSPLGSRLVVANVSVRFDSFDDAVFVSATAFDANGNSPTLPNPVLVDIVVDPTSAEPIRAFLTVDYDGDGRVDHLRVQFTEDVDHASADPADFSVAGRTVVSVHQTLPDATGASSTAFYLLLDEGDVDTATTPAATYTPGVLRNDAGRFVPASPPN